MRSVGAVSSTHPQGVHHPKEKGLSHGHMNRQPSAEIGINVRAGWLQGQQNMGPLPLLKR